VINSTKKQMRIKKLFHFLSSLTSKISASRQTIKNLVGDLRDIKMRNLLPKFELCSFNTEVAFQVTDGRTDIEKYFGLMSLKAPTI